MTTRALITTGEKSSQQQRSNTAINKEAKLFFLKRTYANIPVILKTPVKSC